MYMTVNTQSYMVPDKGSRRDTSRHQRIHHLMTLKGEQILGKYKPEPRILAWGRGGKIQDIAVSKEDKTAGLHEEVP